MARILLADDESMFRKSTKEILQSLGYRVIEATNGLEAVDMFSRQPNLIDLVMLDIIMPGLRGGEAARRMRRIRKDVPILFASGYDFGESTDNSVRLSHSNVLKKPFRISQLSQSIRQLLKETEQA